ncbi:uncharacterized protein ALTATR162_LOCUS2780 [Alternaria atra]|uniref:Uncharacterized protein n=1 Tax=Alternaria atra TaxID=119953 RepID=A0A8J2HYC8_9PLEO|nr:uncharacterized protein ALTATR162_LOCUS2780 [Alternaria atra]CAG5152461.1 unnamed protein product [Alternaria atra]
MPSLSILLALGAMSSIATADNIYTYTKPGCTGPAFFFKDIDHNICAVSITGNATSTADAIAKGLTTVASGKLEETGKKHFLAWDEGPASNADGPLQCGTISKNIAVKQRETCISGSLHGFSWTEPGADGKDSNDFDMDDADDVNGKVKRQANNDPIWTCTGSTDPDAVFIGGKHYNIDDIPAADKDALMEMAMNDATPPAEFEKYVFTPDF